MTIKILIIDDDRDTAQLVKLILMSRDIVVHHAPTGQDGLKLAYELQPELIILDIMMPGMDGFEVCSRLREFSTVPVLILTAKTWGTDVQRGFAAGADDFLKKPFNNEELLARIDHLLKIKKNSVLHLQTKHLKEYQDGILKIDFGTQKVFLQEKEVALTSTETRLLSFLIRHPGQVLAARTILADVWGNGYLHDKSLLPFYIHQLRQKLKAWGVKHEYIQTQWGQGYQFNPPPSPEEVLPEAVMPGPKEEVKRYPAPGGKLVWLPVAVLLVFVTAIAFQKYLPQVFGYPMRMGQTSVEATVTAEGFKEADVSGVRGRICIENTGEHPTSNLSIVNNVHIYSKSTLRYISSTLDLREKPVLESGEVYCYPFEITFIPLSEQDVQYRATTLITITNYTAISLDDKYCPTPEPCPFGPEITTAFTFPDD